MTAMPSAVSDVLARISTLRAAPAAVATIKRRFGADLTTAATTTGSVSSGGLTQSNGNAGVKYSATAVQPGLGSDSSITVTGTGSCTGSGTVPVGGVGSTAAGSSVGVAGAVTPGVVDGAWASRLPSAGQPWASQIQASAEQYGLDPAYLAAAIWTESDFQPQVVSSAGAIGMGQLMPATAEYLGVDPWNPAQNIDGSARYYSNLIGRFDGSVELGTAAYMAGPTAVAKAGAIPSDRAQTYVDKILGRQAYLNGTAASPP